MSKKGTKHWSRIDKQRLISFWAHQPQAELLRMFPCRSWGALQNKAAELGLRRAWKWNGSRVGTRDPVMEQLRDIRLSKNRTAKRIARDINVCDRFIAQCERGAAQPSYHLLTRWCAALGVSIKIEAAKEMGT